MTGFARCCLGNCKAASNSKAGHIDIAEMQGYRLLLNRVKPSFHLIRQPTHWKDTLRFAEVLKLKLVCPTLLVVAIDNLALSKRVLAGPCNGRVFELSSRPTEFTLRSGSKNSSCLAALSASSTQESIMIVMMCQTGCEASSASIS